MNTSKNTLSVWALAVSALLLLNVPTFANENVKDEVKLVVKPMESKKVLFGLAHLQGQRAELAILDAKGKVIYRELWKNQEEGAHIFNFSQLAEGEYKFRVTVGTQVLQESVLINKKDVCMSKEAVLLPHVNVSGKKVVLSLSNPSDSALDFVLRFFDAKGNLVYSESPKAEGIQFAKRYNFEQMGKGVYTYAIVQGANTYKGEFEIK